MILTVALLDLETQKGSESVTRSFLQRQIKRLRILGVKRALPRAYDASPRVALLDFSLLHAIYHGGNNFDQRIVI
jgi:hypothetical protein